MEFNLSLKIVRLKIYGHVHGVFYRQTTQQKARELGLRGYVKNLSNGSVEVVACGNSSDIDQLIDFCQNNPGSSQVDRLDVARVDEPKEEFNNFEIK